ncbi:YehR family lipoprotein [Staphylococcus simiae]|uniref:Putative lipoprotein n=1 Tax=Staphylococcus simiae CCM 7213 = CCUG 51256 TaxID=911238 RepID=G5JHY4_9STAP|nr:DUF1307 domain-containing protein [Staphylococcus simiae]EHJ08177.1 putative lipoprotein [Staphylococcus simiae CCM 7213 = CCUG 51256]PNZ14291.1 DUF1307 domain-containing protein [Staphylococcus simiae]SNV81581.1 lipoprotein [Staphylococcus simiae]
MKKITTLFIIMILSVVTLTACSKEQTKTYEGDINGKQVITTLTYKGDDLLKQSTIGTVKYDDLGIDKQKAKKLFAKNEKAFKNLKGTDYNVDYKKNKAVEHIDVDFKEANIKELKKRLGYVSPSDDDSKISFEKMEKQLKRSGLTEKSNMNDN